MPRAEAAAESKRTGSKSVPTCATCKVPMNLCHCSNSCCSVCNLGATSGCVCIARAPPPPKPCVKCTEYEKAAEKAGEAHAKALAAKDREVAELKKKLAEARTQAQSEREVRAALENKHAKHAEELQAQLRAAAQIKLEAPPREAELERSLAHALSQAHAAEARAKASDGQCVRLRDELADAKAHADAADQRAALAAETQMAHVAEAAEAAAVEKQLKKELTQIAAERAAAEKEVRIEAETEARALRLQLEKTSASRDELRKSLEELKSKAESGGLLVSEDIQKLQTQLADALERSRALQSRNGELEGRVEVLTAERTQLAGSLAEANRIRELFSKVTNRTNQVQEAANEVIEKVEARKRAAKKAEQQAAQQEAGAAPPKTASAGGLQPPMSSGGPPPKSAGPKPPKSAGPRDGPREGWGTSHSARDPLQPAERIFREPLATKPQMPNPLAEGGPWPPKEGAGGRKGLPPGRSGVRSVLSARG